MGTQNKKNQLIIIGLVAIALLVAGGFAYNKYRTPKNTNASNGSSIDLSPATPQDKEESDRQKNAAVDAEQQQNNNPGAKKSVTPVIVDANQYGEMIEVRSYVPGVVEEGATCTATLTKGSLSVTRQVIATKDATTTLCPKTTISRSEFPEPGTWSVTINYSSPTASGSSKPTTFEVK